MPVEGRDLSSRRTQDVVRDLGIGQPINSEECSETADGVARESEGRSWLPLLRPVRQDQPGRHLGPCLCSMPLQQGRTGRGRSGLRGHRRVRGAAVAWRTAACAQAGDVSTGPYQKSVHTKANGELRPLGISTLRDRVCMTAAMSAESQERGLAAARTAIASWVAGSADSNREIV